MKEDTSERPMEEGSYSFISAYLVNTIKHVLVVLFCASSDFPCTHHLHPEFCHIQRIREGTGASTCHHAAKHRLKESNVGFDLARFRCALEIACWVVMDHHALEMLIEHKVESGEGTKAGYGSSISTVKTHHTLGFHYLLESINITFVLIRMHVGLNLSPFLDYVNRYKNDA